ncbi:hypothetical protein M3Y99_00473100 [Aphelenchoides fujianensis]|nr:hypothetical protein M3Y99_00473100 [Aphelenchoides fujianensis]
MSVQGESELVAVDLDGFAYGGEAIDVPLSQGNISYILTLDEFEDSNREEPVEQVESPVARPPSPVPPQEVNEEPAHLQPPFVQEVKEEPEVKQEAREEQAEPPAVAPTPAAPPVPLQQVKQEEKGDSDEEEEDPDVPGPSHGRPATRKRKKKEPPTKRERSETPPIGVKREPADEQPPGSRPSTSLWMPLPLRHLVSQEVVRDKIRELEQKPNLLYLDVQGMTEEAATWLVNYWKRMPHCKVLVLRVKEVPLRTKYALEPPTRMVHSTRAPTDFLLFYCKMDAQRPREAIVEEAPETLSFRELAEELIPVLQIPCALLVPDVLDRNTVDVAALALSNVFVV